jgi:membrane peptidoglycan carboxypeptidase
VRVKTAKGIINAQLRPPADKLEAPPVPSLVLGTGDVSLLSLTMAYAVFANGGLLQRPLMIRRVEDANGAVLLQGSSESHRVISAQTAFQISAMLADVIDRGTAWQARQGGFRQPAAGKTGTTNDYRDAWFVGYTPDLAAGVPRPTGPHHCPRRYATIRYRSGVSRDATAGTKGRSSRPAWAGRRRNLPGLRIAADAACAAHVSRATASRARSRRSRRNTSVRGRNQPNMPYSRRLVVRCERRRSILGAPGILRCDDLRRHPFADCRTARQQRHEPHASER